jgi:hypothetical protein
MSSQPTASLCPVCLARLDARRVSRGPAVYLEKACPEHGFFAARIWDGEPIFTGWQRPKIPTRPPHCGQTVNKGCPFDCGLCPDHRQRSCTIILEVTERCNLDCPVCYADAGKRESADPPLEVIAKWYAAARLAGSGSNIQLSGGEPTLRDDLPQIVAMGREAGFGFIQINTNGLRLAQDPTYLKELKTAGLASVFLQFDGTDNSIYRKLRGRDLLDTKLATIAACERHQIGVVLVPTLVPGVNDRDVGHILGLAVERSPVVRAVHFQPVSYFGRFPHPPEDQDRITLPELMRLIETQTEGVFQAAQFSPPGCENALCSFSANFMVMPDQSIRSVGGAWSGSCCPQPIEAERGAANAIGCVARQWSAPQGCACSSGPSLSGPDGTGDGGALDLDAFLLRAKNHMLAVSAMAFQDVWNLDLERVRDCCIHVMAPDTRLVPFCLYNLTSCRGQRFYRP